MEKVLWVVYFESANYCGAGEYCLVWATTEDDANEAATCYAENYFYEQDIDQYLEENDGEGDGVMYASLIQAYELSSDEAEDIRRYLLDETQKGFYPIVNSK
jgi:hypothetical protein